MIAAATVGQRPSTVPVSGETIRDGGAIRTRVGCVGSNQTLSNGFVLQKFTTRRPPFLTYFRRFPQQDRLFRYQPGKGQALLDPRPQLRERARTARRASPVVVPVRACF